MAGRWAAITLMGALLLAAVDAAGDSPASFAATSLQWKGAATIEASAPLMDLRLPDGEARFELKAAHVRIETDSQRKVVVGPALSTTAQPAETTAVEADDWDSEWVAQPAAGLFLQSDAGTTLSAATTWGAASVPGAACLAEPTYFTTGRPENCPGLGDAVAIESDAPSWSLSGNFSLTLWNWESTSDPDSWSGARPTGAGAAGVGEQEFRSVRLFVTQGTLQVSSVHALHGYAAAAILASTPETAIAATGQDGAGMAAGTIEIRRSDVGLQARAVSEVSHRTPWLGRAAWGLAVAGLVLLPGVAMAVRRKVAKDHMLNAAHGMMIGNYDAAISHALDASRHAKYRREASLVASLGMLRAGHLDAAERFIGTLASTLDRAPLAYLQANLRAMQGRATEAKALLAECTRLDPALRSEIEANPLFAAIHPRAEGAGYQ